MASATLPVPVRFLTPEEAADYLRVSTNTLRNWRHLQQGPNFSKSMGRIRYEEMDLVKWLRAGKRVEAKEEK